MTIAYSDILLLQMQQQAMLFDLSSMQGRQWSTQRITDFFINIQHLLPVQNIVEIGAHEAGFSLSAKKKFPQFNVFAYEANPYVYEKYINTPAIQNSAIHYEHLAVSNYDGDVTFHISNTIQAKQEAKDSKRHSILERKTNDSTTDITVKCNTLDTLFKNELSHNQGFSLWIDAEGATSLILEGAKNLLPHVYSVFVEVESQTKFKQQWNEKELCDFMLENDFLPVARDFAFRHQYNMIFVKKDYINTIEFLYQNHFSNTLSAKIRFISKQSPLSLLKTRYTNSPAAETLLQKALPARISSLEELEKAYSLIPELREEKELTNISGTVVVCHDAELDFTINWYTEKLGKVPTLYVKDLSYNKYPDLAIYDLNQIDNSMNIHVFFKQGKAPSMTKFASLAMALHYKGVSKYSIEAYSMELMYCNKLKTDFSEEDNDALIAFYNVLEDMPSKYTFLAACKARKLGRPGFIPMANFEQYIHPQVPFLSTDIMCEGGIDNGETSELFSQLQKDGLVYAFEPVKESFRNCQKRLMNFSNVLLINKALWSKTCQIGLNTNTLSLSSAYINAADTENLCDAICIDDFFADKKLDCIKLDVEGAEIPVLEGALKTISKQKPKLLLSIYHRRNGLDLVNIPKLLAPFYNDYQFYVAHHRPWYNETILYAIAK